LQSNSKFTSLSENAIEALLENPRNQSKQIVKNKLPMDSNSAIS